MCPNGERAVSGGGFGAQVVGAEPPLLKASNPVPGTGVPRGWSAEARLPSGGPALVNVYVVCTP
jgi:hypothetical protein